MAENAILKNFYVDDLLGGADTIEEAKTLYTELMTLLPKRGFNLRKWKSNSTTFLNCVEAEQTTVDLKIDENSETLKVLGLSWNSSKDYFSFDVTLPENSNSTKRQILSESSRVFDPLGLISPVTVLFKIILQKLWLKKCEWDEADPDISKIWEKLRNSLVHLKMLKVPRLIDIKSPHIELHGFSDASELAYAAVVYSRITTAENEHYITIITSKTKVSPIKQISIPRLELCAAVLLSKLMKFVSSNLQISPNQCFSWTDSKVVLAWLSANPRKWKSFIANRTSFILTSTTRSNWNYVKSAHNPADIASRGMLPEQLINSELWWHGPHWLKEDWKLHTSSTNHNQTEIEHINLEKREKYLDILHININENSIQFLFTEYSTLSPILYILGRCFKFIRKCRAAINKTSPIASYMTCDDINRAHNSLIKWSQNEAFKEELHQLKSSSQVKSSSSLSHLTPFIDQLGIIRIGGRLEHASIAYNAKHPIILPKDHIFVSFLLQYYHTKHFHCGLNQMLALLRQNYWILSCRSLVKSLINKCVICVKQRGKLCQQLMGNLPKQRLQSTRAFNDVGIDYAGPLEILLRRGRGATTTTKAYIALFICCSTRAIHLELAGDLSTDTFLGCLKRFVARRGLPNNLYSDNGTNFVGANNAIKEFYHHIIKFNTDPIIHHFILDNRIQWHFNPPGAPHFGGLWEAGVKSVKSILRKVINNVRLTYEEMNTILVQIEGLLNSRPLAPLTDEPSNLDALTPAHFLTGQPITTLPETTDYDLCLQERWRMAQKLQRDFWNRWYHEYLSMLQQRPKWQQIEVNVKIGDLVTIKDQKLPPGKWLLGKVIDIHEGSDKLTRVATIQTSKNTIQRVINKLCVLPVN
jgi:hypothetical protein